MIGFLRGRLLLKQPPDVVLDVGGVGYEVQVPMTTLFDLPAVGEEVTLLTHFVVREDAQLLYGFRDEADRRLFRELIRVSGVGPKLALALLSGLDARAFAKCLQRDDIASLVALPGVGRNPEGRRLSNVSDQSFSHSDLNVYELGGSGSSRDLSEVPMNAASVNATHQLLLKLLGKLEVLDDRLSLKRALILNYSQNFHLLG